MSRTVGHMKSCMPWVLAIALLPSFHSALHGQPSVAPGQPSLSELFAQRVKSIAAVEFVLVRELDRRPFETAALIYDAQGHAVMHEEAVPDWVRPERLQDWKVYVPGEGGDGYKATYLGRDYLTGWHYLQVEEAGRGAFNPITAYPTRAPEIGDFVWGIGLGSKEMEYKPYLLHGLLSATHPLPLEHGFSQDAIAGPGCPIFTRDGALAGWAKDPIVESLQLYVSGEQMNVGLRDPTESTFFQLSESFLEDLGRIPEKVSGDPQPWIGVSGFLPVDRDYAAFLGVKDQGAVVISEVLPDSPARRAGLVDKDIILGVDKKPLPRLSPDTVVQNWFEREILKKLPGESIKLRVMREKTVMELTVKLAEAPKTYREAEDNYFPDLGFTIREMLVYDAIRLRHPTNDLKGVMVSYVKPNSPPAAANLGFGDWILEIDGEPVVSFEQAVTLLAQIESNPARRDYVLLVSRNNETSVLRIQKQ